MSLQQVCFDCARGNRFRKILYYVEQAPRNSHVEASLPWKISHPIFLEPFLRRWPARRTWIAGARRSTRMDGLDQMRGICLWGVTRFIYVSLFIICLKSEFMVVRMRPTCRFLICPIVSEKRSGLLFPVEEVNVSKPDHGLTCLTTALSEMERILLKGRSLRKTGQDKQVIEPLPRPDDATILIRLAAIKSMSCPSTQPAI